MSNYGKIRERSRNYHVEESGRLKDILLVAVLTLGLSVRLLIAPYTSHGYDLNVHKTWLFRLLETGLFFYTAPEGMELFGKSWGHNPDFCELPPIYPFTLFLMAKVYAFLRPSLEDVYLLVLLMKLPQIIAECGIAILIYYIVRKETDVRLGACAALLFLINPFTFFLTAVWGAPESLVAIFVVASIYMAHKSRYFLAAWLLGVSLLVKPYSIVFLIPLLLFSDFKTLMLPSITAVSAVITALPWLIAQGSVFTRAMWAGAVHNLGIRMWEGTIWAFPSFWQIIKILCDISSFPYTVVAPFEFYVYLSLTFILCFVIIRSRANLEKKNIWFTAYLFSFSFMMFMPSAHEKWVYTCFPLIIIAAFLKREERTISFLIYAGLTFTLFEGIYGNCRYFFMSTDVLPMPRNFVYGAIFAEAWYYTLWSSAGAVARLFFFLPHALFSTLIFFLSLKQASILHAPPRLEARSRKSSDNILQKGRAVDSFHRQPNGFQTPPQKKRGLPILAISIRQIEDEVNEELEAFQSYVKKIKEASLDLEELTKMLKSGEISENAYRLIIIELGDQLSMSVEEVSKWREMLELARAKAKLEWAKEKIGLKKFERPEHQRMLGHDAYLRRELYSPLHRLEEIISKIDAALSSLTMEEEASIIEQYLLLLKERFSPRERSMETERGKALCQQRLDSISEWWTSVRRDKIEQVMNLELKAFHVKEQIREVEVRFAVGELNQTAYEYKIGALHGSLKNVERGISDIRNYIDEMDMKIFRCSELLREKREA